MFSKVFTTNHLSADYVYELLNVIERMGWQADLEEDGKVIVNIPVDDFSLWDTIYTYMIDI